MTADELAWEVATHMRAQEGTHVTTGQTIEAAAAGYARVALDVSPAMLNGHGTTHGGVIFTLADTAFAYACNSHNALSVAQQVSIVFMSPTKAGDRLVAEAIEQSVAGRSGVYIVTVRAADRVVAVFQGLSRALGPTVIPNQID
jgi:acyl-CoA thioesterase